MWLKYLRRGTEIPNTLARANDEWGAVPARVTAPATPLVPERNPVQCRAGVIDGVACTHIQIGNHLLRVVRIARAEVVTNRREAGHAADTVAVNRIDATGHRQIERRVDSTEFKCAELGATQAARLGNERDATRELVAIARQHGLIIIEDGTYALLADDAPPPLASLAPETTVYVSSLSKSVATGLRVGFVCAPGEWVPKLERAIRATV